MNISSNLHTTIYALMISVMLSGCGSDQPAAPPFSTDGSWQEEGFQHSPATVTTMGYREGILFAGSDYGLFSRNLQAGEEEWELVGLKLEDPGWIIDMHIWTPQEIMAAVWYPGGSSTDTVLYKTEDGGQHWESYNENFVGGDIGNKVTQLATNPSNPDEIYAMGELAVAKSVDRGLSWEPVHLDWSYYNVSIRLGYFLRIPPENPAIVWAGGMDDNISPALFKSEDGGQNWVDLSQNIILDSEDQDYISDVILSPGDSDNILAGFGNEGEAAPTIRKSTDGGETWRTVLEETGIRTFTRSARYPDVVYASGRRSEASLFFLISADFGESWEKISHESAAPSTINDLVAVDVDGQEILYLNTSTGIYSYTFVE